LREVFNEVRPGIQYLASVDFRSGYWQIVLDTRDRYKTAFTWKGQSWQYTRLPFGLTCAGQIFSRAVSEALETIPDLEGIFVYVDDVLLATPTCLKLHASLVCDFIQASATFWRNPSNSWDEFYRLKG